MQISLIVSTYNQPDWLELSLWGVWAQTERPLEILVADDGSGPETADRLARFREETGLPVRHVWHEDRGFRKCEILNRAILATGGDYIVFLDGDCIPRRDFVEVHRRLALPGRFLSGGAAKLPMSVSRRITREDVLSGRVSDPRWLRSLGTPRSRRIVRQGLSFRAGTLLDVLTPSTATFNGGNSSLWRTDLVAANGFDERLGYGGQDRELGERLENAGIRGRQVRHRALAVHLDHARGYRNEDGIRRNREIRDETVASGRTRAVVGLDRHLDAT